jgi:m7GpppX diphosphatase
MKRLFKIYYNMSKIERNQYDSSNGAIYRLVLEPISEVRDIMSHLQKDEELSNNVNYSSYRVYGNIPVTGIVYQDNHPDEKDINRLIGNHKPYYVNESDEEYIHKLRKLDPIKLSWIQKIIDGEAEREKVLERRDEYLVVRDWKFDIKYNKEGNAIYNREDLHLLGIPMERICSMRDIEHHHIPMLNKMKEDALICCENIFGMNREEIKIYFHYPPSTYHLHVHFVWIGQDDATVNFDRAFDFDTVLRNITMDSSYYRKSMRYIECI